MSKFMLEEVDMICVVTRYIGQGQHTVFVMGMPCCTKILRSLTLCYGKSISEQVPLINMNVQPGN